jgi:hypothetical protein
MIVGLDDQAQRIRNMTIDLSPEIEHRIEEPAKARSFQGRVRR